MDPSTRKAPSPANLAIHDSYWCEDQPLNQRFARLRGTEHADVLVIGAGITGLSTALELLHRGLSVVVCEALVIGSGTTGASTGHLDAHPEQGPKQLIKTLGSEAAAAEFVYLRKQAIAAIQHRSASGCDFLRIPGYSYSENADDAESLREECDAAGRLGLDVEWADQLPLKFAACGYEIRHLARVNILAYVKRLADAVILAGGRIFENSQVKAPIESEPKMLPAGDGSVTFEHVVSAVHCNFTSSMKLYFQTPPYQSYALVASVNDPPADGLYWDNSDPYYYIRRVRSDQPNLILVGGCDHHTGTSDPVRAAIDLEQYVRTRFDVQRIVQRWSAELFEPTDGLPLIGRVPGNSNVWVATGLSGVGLTLGTLAGWMLADQISGREVPLQKELSPDRFSLSEVGPLARDQVPAAASYARRVMPAGNVHPERLQPGDGVVGNLDGVHTAVCRDKHGCEHRLSPICTHMGGTLEWNAAEQTWDCPVHGGRFTADGQRLYGPPDSSLEAPGQPADASEANPA